MILRLLSSSTWGVRATPLPPSHTGGLRDERSRSRNDVVVSQGFDHLLYPGETQTTRSKELDSGLTQQLFFLQMLIVASRFNNMSLICERGSGYGTKLLGKCLFWRRRGFPRDSTGVEREHRWQTTESAVTGHLYTRRDKFVHTQPDRATNRPVTWSLK